LAWGFAAERSDNGRPTDVLYKEYFKIFLDPKELKRVTEKAPENAPASMQEVEKMYLDYLTCLYNHIKAILSGLEFPDRPWEQVVIEYIFSVPTTWTDQNVIERFRNIAQAAGFGSVRSHQLTIGLTEAEAAAVHVSKGQPKLFSAGDVLLMCDAGGGTTDLSVLQISSNVADILDLRQVDYVNGKAIGSVAIDDDFCNLVSERLFKADAERPLGLNEDDIHQQAWEVSLNSFFQDTKCSFGDSNSRNFASTDTFACPLRRVPYAYVNDKRGIRGQEIKITFQALQTIFDKQVDKLFRHIDSQIKRVARHRIRYLILSGGLGHSQYVQQRLKQRYETDMEAGHAILVRVANDPQLAVCIGLVRDRVQRLDSGRSALSVRVCRESYGVQCDIDVTKGDQKLYGEARKEKDSRDQKDYYKNCIRWLIKQGEPVHADEANSWNFCRLFAKGQKDVPYTVRLLKSSAPADSIPHVVALGASMLFTSPLLTPVDEYRRCARSVSNQDIFCCCYAYRV